MALHLFSLDQIAATPWKNGGGSTQEIACWPLGADFEHFEWRVSLARVTQPGPFSRFPGVDRVLALYAGDGLLLRDPVTQAEHRLDQPLAPHAFAGDGGMDCDMLGGPSSDINLMLRRGRWQGHMHVLHQGATLPAQRAGVLLAVQGTWRAVGGGSTHTLAQGSGLWWADQACAWQLACGADGGTLLHMQLQAVGSDPG